MREAKAPAYTHEVESQDLTLKFEATDFDLETARSGPLCMKTIGGPFMCAPYLQHD